MKFIKIIKSSEDKTYYFQYFNSNFGDWEDMELTIFRDEDTNKFYWFEGDGGAASEGGFDTLEQAIQDYKKTVKELGNEVKGL